MLCLELAAVQIIAVDTVENSDFCIAGYLIKAGQPIQNTISTGDLNRGRRACRLLETWSPCSHPFAILPVSAVSDAQKLATGNFLHVRAAAFWFFLQKQKERKNVSLSGTFHLLLKKQDKIRGVRAPPHTGRAAVSANRRKYYVFSPIRVSAGSRILTTVPAPSTLSTEIVPLCASTISLAIESPSPVPPAPVERDLSTR